MNYRTEEKLAKVGIWATIDFTRVKQRINRVNTNIEEVLQRHELPSVLQKYKLLREIGDVRQSDLN